MTPFDNENKKYYLYQEFSKIDKFHREFRTTVSESLVQVVRKHHEGLGENEKTNTVINAYSGHLIDVIESVIEKDRNYTEYRIMIELHRMKKVATKITQPISNVNFQTEVESVIKSMAVNHFPSIIDFTANGFRLLDINLKVFIRDFLTDFYFDIKRDSPSQA